jgi:hypothetical protein
LKPCEGLVVLSRHERLSEWEKESVCTET